MTALTMSCLMGFLAFATDIGIFEGFCVKYREYVPSVAAIGGYDKLTLRQTFQPSR